MVEAARKDAAIERGKVARLKKQLLRAVDAGFVTTNLLSSM